MAVDAHITDPALVAALETSRASCEQALALVDLVSQASAAAPNETLPLSALTEISKQQKLLTTNIAHLRGLHRSAHFRARETKGQTAEARHEVDVLHLQLQNLYYEQRHLKGEISACESFDHTYQSLPLIPVDEFLAAHPEHANADENALLEARINHERKEREALEQQRLELQKRKQALITENKKRRDDLANLDKDLEKFIDAAKPIQKLFEKVV
ncbi:Fms-interacting protein-domain-containing protein [Cercophora newfieldiana]|uniref:Fms-interacting protein-domain-containing protein n=1 Tax=Cercophora newfieldiana TaxID=92897 RepID=A0AA39YTP2_9PEZI|nr:Fms-interacting protein-domain-containing protein [Cercophora newfieldiana]